MQGRLGGASAYDMSRRDRPTKATAAADAYFT